MEQTAFIPVAFTVDQGIDQNARSIVPFVPFSIRGRRPSQNFSTKLTTIFEALDEAK